MNPNFFNLSKRKKRDLLAELLSGGSTAGIISKKELNALNKLIGDTRQVNSINNKHPGKSKFPGKKTEETKRKITHYVSAEILDRLDSAMKDIQSLLPDDSRSKISKSQIVNQALESTLKEFETKGNKSKLVRNILQKNKV